LEADSRRKRGLRKNSYSFTVSGAFYREGIIRINFTANFHLV